MSSLTLAVLALVLIPVIYFMGIQGLTGKEFLEKIGIRVE